MLDWSAPARVLFLSAMEVFIVHLSVILFPNSVSPTCQDASPPTRSLYFAQVSLLASLCALFCEVGVLFVLLTPQQVPVAAQCFTQQYNFKTGFIYVFNLINPKEPMAVSSLPLLSPQNQKRSLK